MTVQLYAEIKKIAKLISLSMSGSRNYFMPMPRKEKTQGVVGKRAGGGGRSQRLKQSSNSRY